MTDAEHVKRVAKVLYDIYHVHSFWPHETDDEKQRWYRVARYPLQREAAYQRVAEAARKVHRLGHDVTLGDALDALDALPKEETKREG